MSLALQTLPIEIVFRIFDHVNDNDLFLAVNNTCQRLNAILNCYRRFQVDLLLRYLSVYRLLFFSYRQSHDLISIIRELGLKAFEISAENYEIIKYNQTYFTTRFTICCCL